MKSSHIDMADVLNQLNQDLLNLKGPSVDRLRNLCVNSRKGFSNKQQEMSPIKLEQYRRILIAEHANASQHDSPIAEILEKCLQQFKVTKTSFSFFATDYELRASSEREVYKSSQSRNGDVFLTPMQILTRETAYQLLDYAYSYESINPTDAKLAGDLAHQLLRCRSNEELLKINVQAKQILQAKNSSLIPILNRLTKKINKRQAWANQDIEAIEDKKAEIIEEYKDHISVLKELIKDEVTGKITKNKIGENLKQLKSNLKDWEKDENLTYENFTRTCKNLEQIHSNIKNDLIQMPYTSEDINIRSVDDVYQSKIKSKIKNKNTILETESIKTESFPSEKLYDETIKILEKGLDQKTKTTNSIEKNNLLKTLEIIKKIYPDEETRYQEMCSTIMKFYSRHQKSFHSRFMRSTGFEKSKMEQILEHICEKIKNKDYLSYTSKPKPNIK